MVLQIVDDSGDDPVALHAIAFVQQELDVILRCHHEKQKSKLKNDSEYQRSILARKAVGLQ